MYKGKKFRDAATATYQPAPAVETEPDVVPNENLLSGRNPIREALKSGRDIEKLLGTKVMLKLWVKVRENWRNHAEDLENLGYTEQ